MDPTSASGVVYAGDTERPAGQLPSITCPECGWTSRHREDIREGYCGHCHWWTSDRMLAPLRHVLRETLHGDR